VRWGRGRLGPMVFIAKPFSRCSLLGVGRSGCYRSPAGRGGLVAPHPSNSFLLEQGDRAALQERIAPAPAGPSGVFPRTTTVDSSVSGFSMKAVEHGEGPSKLLHHSGFEDNSHRGRTCGQSARGLLPVSAASRSFVTRSRRCLEETSARTLSSFGDDEQSSGPVGEDGGSAVCSSAGCEGLGL